MEKSEKKERKKEKDDQKDDENNDEKEEKVDEKVEQKEEQNKWQNEEQENEQEKEKKETEEKETEEKETEEKETEEKEKEDKEEQQVETRVDEDEKSNGEQLTWPISSFHSTPLREEARRQYEQEPRGEDAYFPNPRRLRQEPYHHQWLDQIQHNPDPFFWNRQRGLGHQFTGRWRWDPASYQYVWQWDQAAHFDPQWHYWHYGNGWAWPNNHSWSTPGWM